MDPPPRSAPASSPLFFDLRDIVHEVDLLRRTNAELEEMVVTEEEEEPFVRAVMRENVVAILAKCSKAYNICESLGVPVPAGLLPEDAKNVQGTDGSAVRDSAVVNSEKQAIGLLL